MKLQVSSRLAIYALMELADGRDRQVSVTEIGEKYGVSAHHLAKVMHTLGRAGLVRSIRGVGGGYVFCGNARRTTLLDVIVLFENPSAGQEDIDAAKETPAGIALERVLTEIDEIALATLGAITLSTLQKHKKTPGTRRTRSGPVPAGRVLIARARESATPGCRITNTGSGQKTSRDLRCLRAAGDATASLGHGLMRTPSAFAMAFLLLATPGYGAPMVTTSNVNFRQGPGTSHPSIGVVPAGTEVDVAEWQRIGQLVRDRPMTAATAL